MSSSFYVGEAIFSAGGVLLNPKNKKVYLVYKNTINEWLLPKGRIEKGETIEGSASREIFEETGYKNKVSNFLSVQIRQDVLDPTKNKAIFWFLSLLTIDEQVANTQTEYENFSGKWFIKEEAVRSLKWEDDKKLIEKAFEVAEQI